MLQTTGVAADTSDMQQTNADPQHAFWRTHHRSGLVVAAGGGGLLVAYALLTWERPDRAWLLVIGLVVLLVVPPLLLLLPDGVESRSRWRVGLYYVLEVVGIAVVTAAAWLDGGLGSPLVLLYLVLLVHGIAVYPTRVAVVMTGLVMGSYLLLALLQGVDAPRALAAAGAILLTAVVAAVGARSHISLHQHQSRTQAALHRQARIDPLTGAYNRQGIQETLQVAFATSDRAHPTAVLALDLDGFKLLNDTEGHQVGDDVLQRFVSVLEGASRQDDVVGRLGGDEFLLLLPEADAEVADRVAARVHAQLLREGVPVTVSIGIATTSGREAPQTVLARADAALYAAKRDGRGRTRRQLAST